MPNTEEMLSKCSGKRKVMQCSASCRQCVLMTTTPYVHIAFLQKDQSIRVKTIGVKKKGEISLFLSFSLSLSLSVCVCVCVSLLHDSVDGRVDGRVDRRIDERLSGSRC
jgi:hypothetical protein